MLHLSARQVQTLDVERLCGAVERALRPSLSHLLISPEQLRLSIHDHLHWARRYGISSERSLVRFSCLVLLLGGVGTAIPLLHRHFDQAAGSANDRVDTLLEDLAGLTGSPP